jgi:hypothetical protein
MHRSFAALGAGVLNGHPLASASCICRGIVTNVIATTPSTASAATIAITTIIEEDVLDLMSFVSPPFS